MGYPPSWKGFFGQILFITSFCIAFYLFSYRLILPWLKSTFWIYFHWTVSHGLFVMFLWSHFAASFYHPGPVPASWVRLFTSSAPLRGSFALTLYPNPECLLTWRRNRRMRILCGMKLSMVHLLLDTVLLVQIMYRWELVIATSAGLVFPAEIITAYGSTIALAWEITELLF